MFADVAGSTQLFEVLGDDMARATIAETLELLTNVINSHNGTVIKTIGDEVMCTFPEADDSANAATEMQETLEDANDMREEGPKIKVRIGMHFILESSPRGLMMKAMSNTRQKTNKRILRHSRLTRSW